MLVVVSESSPALANPFEDGLIRSLDLNTQETQLLRSLIQEVRAGLREIRRSIEPIVARRGTRSSADDEALSRAGQLRLQTDHLARHPVSGWGQTGDRRQRSGSDKRSRDRIYNAKGESEMTQHLVLIVLFGLGGGAANLLAQRALNEWEFRKCISSSSSSWCTSETCGSSLNMCMQSCSTMATTPAGERGGT